MVGTFLRNHYLSKFISLFLFQVATPVLGTDWMTFQRPDKEEGQFCDAGSHLFKPLVAGSGRRLK